MKQVLSLLLLLLIHSSYAEEGFPKNCQPISMLKQTLTLHAKEPMMVFIHNVSAGDLWITHPVSEPSASAGWSSRLETGNWSALIVDKKSFELSCIESKPGHEQQTPCSAALTVCQWTSVKLPDQAQGTFWAGENMPLDALKAYVGGKGFILPANNPS